MKIISSVQLLEFQEEILQLHFMLGNQWNILKNTGKIFSKFYHQCHMYNTMLEMHIAITYTVFMVDSRIIPSILNAKFMLDSIWIIPSTLILRTNSITIELL